MHRRLARHLFSQSSTDIVRGSTTRGQRNFAVAVTVSTDASEIKKSQKRMSKDERRSMVEAFVNNYRAMNSGNFPTPSTVQKEVGGSYYVIKDMVQQLQHKSQTPSTGTGNNTTYIAKLHENADAIFRITDTTKNIEFAAKEEDGPDSVREEKTLLDEIAKMPTMTSETTVSFKEDKLENPVEGAPTSALNGKTSSDTLIDRTLEATVEVKKVELAAQVADEPTSPLQYENFSEEIAKPSVTDDSSAETAKDRYLENEAEGSYSTSISEDNIVKKTTEVDQRQQSSDSANLTRDMTEEHEKKLFKWSLKSLVDGFIRMWRRS